ncbi:MAG: nucleotidyltransferase domain-containing protein [Anaerolineales bacterium]|nr:nucleotidyltransferase domain-containing protein [Anaerolineales bacterium]
MQLTKIKQFKRQLLEIAKKHGIKQVYIFGSVARGDASATSDVDLLIEMDANASVLGIGGFQYEVQNLLGTPVDVVPTFALNKETDEEFVKAIQGQAIPL